MTASAKLSVQGLAKYYDGNPVLERIALKVDAGSFCTIVGASGCGKSTFLRMLLSQEHPTHGEILLDGTPLPKEPTPDRGIVFQKYSVFTHLTVVENLILAQEFEQAPRLGKLLGARRKTAVEQIEDVLERIGLAAARDKYPAQLSGGCSSASPLRRP
jgi:NitT/TauT family transport system ATP-binding protein